MKASTFSGCNTQASRLLRINMSIPLYGSAVPRVYPNSATASLAPAILYQLQAKCPIARPVGVLKLLVSQGDTDTACNKSIK
jgi:hypothetical protein